MPSKALGSAIIDRLNYSDINLKMGKYNWIRRGAYNRCEVKYVQYY